MSQSPQIIRDHLSMAFKGYDAKSCFLTNDELKRFNLLLTKKELYGLC
jgi:hypothetical protein